LRFFTCQRVIEELERLINDGVQTRDFTQENFFIAFSSIMGILGSITFLYNEGVLQKPLDDHCDEIAQAICRALQS